MLDAEVAEVDAFIGEFKALKGYLPPWRINYGRDWTTRWAILDSLEIERGELCFTIDEKLETPSIVAVMAVRSVRRMFYRLDLVPAAECEPNPYGARALKLPPIVCGPHTHPWPENREFVRINGFRELPFRKPIAAEGLELRHALAVAAEHLNLTVRGDQRDIHPPPQGALFARERQ